MMSYLLATPREGSLCARKSPPLLSHTYTNRSPPSWRRGCSPGVRVAAARVIRYSTAVWCKARQCNATSVGNQPLETIICVARIHASCSFRAYRNTRAALQDTSTSFAENHSADVSRMPAHAREVVDSALSSGWRQSHGDQESTCLQRRRN